MATPTKQDLSTKKYLPGTSPGTVRTIDGKTVAVPTGWELLPPGDAALTRRVKLAGEFWQLEEKKGRKVFSLGIYAPTQTIGKIRAQLESERSTESYAKRRESDAKRRQATQEDYVEDFQSAVLSFLAFHPRHQAIASILAKRVTEHATPIGSGTVARTKRIPIEQRAESAVIAWMRHQTTAYDTMKIPRVAGKRREVRRMLAERSRSVLDSYRRGLPADSKCPLQQAVIDRAVRLGEVG